MTEPATTLKKLVQTKVELLQLLNAAAVRPILTFACLPFFVPLYETS